LRNGVEGALDNLGHVALSHAEFIGYPNYKFTLGHGHSSEPSFLRLDCFGAVSEDLDVRMIKRALYELGPLLTSRLAVQP
jgi:hypothetical protein